MGGGKDCREPMGGQRGVKIENKEDADTHKNRNDDY